MAELDSKITPDKTYSIKDNTFLAVPKKDPKDLIQKEIGDSKTLTEFIPQQKIMRWDNEVNVSVRLVQNEKAPVITKKGDIIKWSGDKIDAKFYDINSEEHPEGASEFEIILKEKPKTNVVQFTLVDKGVEYFHQPEIEDSEIEGYEKMTSEELLAKKREMRPENVVGSYAVYASEKKVNYVGGKEYKCGKVGHIYRPQIEDSSGNKVWGELNISNGILSVTIPQEFLDTAVYPVNHAAGLTFGYTTKGATEYNMSQNYIYLNKYGNTGGSAGTLNSITAFYKQNSSNTPKTTHAIYTDSSNAPNSIVDYTEEWTLTSSFNNWKTLNAVGGASISASEYWMGFWFDKGVYMYADSLSITRMLESRTYSGSWPSTSSASYSGTTDYSIYATYTAGGGSNDFVIQDASSASSADNVALTQGGGTLAIADENSASSIDNIVLQFQGNFQVADEVSASSIDNITLARNGGTFVINDASSLSTSDNVTIIFQGTFAIADAISSSSTDNIELTLSSGLLTIQDSNSLSSADNITLQFVGTFSIDNSVSISVADNVTLILASGVFIIDDCVSVSTAQNITIQHFFVVPEELKVIVLVDTGEIALWIGGNMYIHGPPH